MKSIFGVNTVICLIVSALLSMPMSPTMMKENAPIVKKASKFIGSVNEAYQSPEPRTPVKVADFDDIEGVKNRQKKWEEGQVSHAEGTFKQQPEGYKVDETEEIKARRNKWEEGQVITSGAKPAAPEGYKVDETEEVKARRNKWEEGQVSRAEGIKQPAEGYKVEETEEIKARRNKWEEGQVITTGGAKPATPEGYRLSDSVGVKDRLNKWSQVSQVPTLNSDSKKPVTLVEGGEGSPASDLAGTKDRLKQWEGGAQLGSGSAGTSKQPVKVSEEDTAGVKDRLGKWAEVTKDPDQPAARKEPLKIYDDSDTQ